MKGTSNYILINEERGELNKKDNALVMLGRRVWGKDDLGERDERVEMEREEGEFWGRNGMENEALTSRELWPEAGTAMDLMPKNTGSNAFFATSGMT